MNDSNEMKSRLVLTVMNPITFIRAGIIFNFNNILGFHLTMTSTNYLTNLAQSFVRVMMI